MELLEAGLVGSSGMSASTTTENKRQYTLMATRQAESGESVGMLTPVLDPASMNQPLRLEIRSKDKIPGDADLRWVCAGPESV